MKQRRKRVGLTIFLILLAIILLLPAAAFGYLALSGYDEARPLQQIEALRDTPYDGARACDKDGAISVLLDGDDVMWLMLEYGYMEEIERFSDAVELQSLGISFLEGGLDLYAKGKLFGFLPLPLRASATAEYAAGDITLTIRDVTVGRLVHVPVEKLAAFGVEETVALDAGEVGLSANSTREITFLPDGVRVVRTTIGSLLSDVFASTRAACKTLSAYGETGTLDGNPLLLVSANYQNIASGSNELTKSLTFAEDYDAALTAYLAAGEPERVRRALADMEPFDRHFLVGATDAQIASAREALLAPVAGKQALYEGWLAALRDKYRAGGLTLDVAGFMDAETGEALSLSALASGPVPDDAESRAVILYSKDALHAVRTADMPLLRDVPRVSNAALQGQYADMRYDVGILTKLPSGIGALLYYEATGDFIVNCVNDALYGEYLAQKKLPILLSDKLPRPATRALQPAPAAGLSPYEVLLSFESMSVSPQK